MAERTVEVVVSASRTVRYSQRKRIAFSVWKKYDEMCNSNTEESRLGDADFNRHFEHLVDELNPSDHDDLVVSQFEFTWAKCSSP